MICFDLARQPKVYLIVSFREVSSKIVSNCKNRLTSPIRAKSSSNRRVVLWRTSATSRPLVSGRNPSVSALTHDQPPGQPCVRYLRFPAGRVHTTGRSWRLPAYGRLTVRPVPSLRLRGLVPFRERTPSASVQKPGGRRECLLRLGSSPRAGIRDRLCRLSTRRPAGCPPLLPGFPPTGHPDLSSKAHTA